MKEKRFSGWVIMFGALSMIAIAALVYSLIEPYWIRIHTFEFSDNDIPREFDGTRVIFISDIHHGPYFSLERVRAVVEKINSLKPDIVLLGGDYVHRDKKYIAPVFEELAHVMAPLFYGAVLGNHDHWESFDESKNSLLQAHIQYLDNHGYWIQKGRGRIKIGGVGDLWEDSQDLSPIIEDTDESDFVLLVTHNPDFFPLLKNYGIDLVLAGHSHGGQVTLFGIWAPILPIKNKSYWKGWYGNQFSTLYVTTGIGTVTPPVRFFCRPEIVVITLVAGSDK